MTVFGSLVWVSRSYSSGRRSAWTLLYWLMLVEGVVEAAFGDDGGGSVVGGAAGEGPAVGVDDDGAADPVDAALVAGSIAGGDEHPVDGGVGLDPDHLGGSLTLGARVRGPVHGGAEQLGAVQCGEPTHSGNSRS